MTLRDGSSGSGERSDKVSCDDALAEIYLLLDKECTPERDAELRRHIEDVPRVWRSTGSTSRSNSYSPASAVVSTHPPS